MLRLLDLPVNNHLRLFLIYITKPERFHMQLITTTVHPESCVDVLRAMRHAPGLRMTLDSARKPCSAAHRTALNPMAGFLLKTTMTFMHS